MDIEEYKKQQIDEYFNNRLINENINLNVETCKLQDGTVCEVTNMKYDEYLKRNGYHTYEEIKRRLGL